MFHKRSLEFRQYCREGSSDRAPIRHPSAAEGDREPVRISNGGIAAEPLSGALQRGRNQETIWTEGISHSESRNSGSPGPHRKALIKRVERTRFTDLKAVAASVGLSSKRRLYKDFRELRMAIVVKNAQFKNRRGRSCGDSTLRAVIDGALRAAFDERPIPTVTEVARRLGFAAVRPVTSRFPELTAELRSCRHRLGTTRCRDQIIERVRQRLSEALAESPPPSCSEIVRSSAGHRTQIREDFPDLWSALRKRYVEHKQQAHHSKRQAFADDVLRAVAELHRKVLPNRSVGAREHTRAAVPIRGHRRRSRSSRPAQTIHRARFESSGSRLIVPCSPLHGPDCAILQNKRRNTFACRPTAMPILRLSMSRV